MNCGVRAICIFLLVANFGDNTQAAQSRFPREQTSFSAETDGAIMPAYIPNEIMTILALDERVASFLRSEGLTPEQAPRSWFSASVIHLSNPNQPDLIVKAEAPILGANITTYWVFRKTRLGYKLILEAHGHDLIVLKKSHDHYRDIEVSGETTSEWSSVVFRFDGGHYVGGRSSSKPI